MQKQLMHIYAASNNDLLLLTDIFSHKEIYPDYSDDLNLELDITNDEILKIFIESMSVFYLYKIFDDIVMKKTNKRFDISTLPRQIIESITSLIDVYIYIFIRENNSMNIEQYLEFNLYDLRKKCEEIFDSNPKIKAKMMAALAEYFNANNQRLFRSYRESFGFFSLRQMFE